jgi:hypothetical protein
MQQDSAKFQRSHQAAVQQAQQQAASQQAVIHPTIKCESGSTAADSLQW